MIFIDVTLFLVYQSVRIPIHERKCWVMKTAILNGLQRAFWLLFATSRRDNLKGDLIRLFLQKARERGIEKDLVHCQEGNGAFSITLPFAENYVVSARYGPARGKKPDFFLITVFQNEAVPPNKTLSSFTFLAPPAQELSSDLVAFLKRALSSAPPSP